PSGLEDRDEAPVDLLVGARERLRHREVVRELNHLEVVIGPSDGTSHADELGEGEIARGARVLAVAVPRRGAVATDLPVAHALLERLDGLPGAREELRAVHLLDLG